MKCYIISNDTHKFEKGTLLTYENKKWTNIDNSDTNSATFEINNHFNVISEEVFEELKGIPKDQRVLYYNSKVGVQGIEDNISVNVCQELQGIPKHETVVQEDKIDENIQDDTKIIASPTFMFLDKKSCFKHSSVTEDPQDQEVQLVKIRCKNDIYGYKTKSFSINDKEYVQITLNKASIKVINSLNKEWLFENRCFKDGEFGVIVDFEYVESVKNNLVYLEDSCFIDMDYARKNDICNCDEFADKNEYIKIKDVEKSKIATIDSCHKINGQHCLKVKLVLTKNANSDYYIHENVVTKKGLNRMIKYFEGCIIDPASIITLNEVESNLFKVGDNVDVTLRDSSRKYEFSVEWLGEVNNVKVAAVKSVINCEFENLVFSGKFLDNVYITSDSYLIPESSLRKIHKNEITQKQVENLIEKLKGNEMNTELYKELSTELMAIESLKSIPTNCDKESLLKLCKNILKLFKKNVFDIKRGKSFELEEKDKTLVECTLLILNISCDFCRDADFVEFIFKKSLLDKVYLILDEISLFSQLPAEIKTIIQRFMQILWHFIKNEFEFSENWMSKMLNIYLNNSDDDIKLAAAVNYCYLSKTYSDVMIYMVEYIKNMLPTMDTRSQSRVLTKCDLHMVLGKISNLSKTDFSSSSDSKSIVNRSETFETSKESVESLKEAELEERPLSTHKLTALEYENCLNVYITKSEKAEDHHYLIETLDNVMDKKMYVTFIENETEIDLEKYHDLLMRNRNHHELIKAFVENGVIKSEKALKNMIELTERFLNENNMDNIELILSKIQNKGNWELDGELLSLGYTLLRLSKNDFFKTTVSKCKDVNHLMLGGETFLTLIIKHKFSEESIIYAMEHGNFNLDLTNDLGECPIVLASKNNMKRVYTFLLSKNVNTLPLCAHISSLNSE